MNIAVLYRIKAGVANKVTAAQARLDRFIDGINIARRGRGAPGTTAAVGKGLQSSRVVVGVVDRTEIECVNRDTAADREADNQSRIVGVAVVRDSIRRLTAVLAAIFQTIGKSNHRLGARFETRYVNTFVDSIKRRRKPSCTEGINGIVKRSLVAGEGSDGSNAVRIGDDCHPVEGIHVVDKLIHCYLRRIKPVIGVHAAADIHDKAD